MDKVDRATVQADVSEAFVSFRADLSDEILSIANEVKAYHPNSPMAAAFRRLAEGVKGVEWHMPAPDGSDDGEDEREE